MLGIIAPMAQELVGILRLMKNTEEVYSFGKSILCGEVGGSSIRLVQSNCGKVSAALATVSLISEGATHILVVGCAGGLRGVKQGDLVVGRELYQHDMDCSPLGFRRCEVPFLGKYAFQASEGLVRLQRRVSGNYSRVYDPNCSVYEANIASGDQFITSPAVVESIIHHTKASCVDMESAAVAQVCSEVGIPMGVFRFISDGSNGNSDVDCKRYINEVLPSSIENLMNLFFYEYFRSDRI